MRKLLLSFLAVFMAYSVSAQFSISRVKPRDVSIIQLDSIKRGEVSNEYFSQSRWLAEKRRVRRERNKVEFGASFQMTQTQFDNWSSGGDNTFSGRATVKFSHKHQRERFGFEYWFNARYGINVIEDKSFKNEDEFILGFKTTWKIKNSWSYASEMSVRSQFTDGHASRTDKTLRSAFMSPGYVLLSVGLNFNNDKSPFNIYFSPIGGNLTVVRNDELSNKGTSGVEKGKHVKGQLGPSTRIKINKTFCKEIFNYSSDLSAFTNIRKSHNARWENTLTIRATKFLSAKTYVQFYYNNEVKTPKKTLMQYNYLFGIGLEYNFKNK